MRYQAEQKKSSTVPGTGKHVPFFGKTAIQPKETVVQPKLTVNAPGDMYEQEADAVADKVMRMPDAPGQPVQRKCAHCEKEEQKKLQRKPLDHGITPLLRRKADNGGEVIDQVAASLKSSWGNGHSLPDDTRDYMESRFGADFGGVKVHTDANSVQLSRDLNAQAFTHGSDIYFNEGKFAPGTIKGNHLLAHELTHVVQQAGGNMPMIQKVDMPDIAAIPPDTAAEKREWVNVLIEFLQISRQFWEQATIDRSQLDRVLDGWQSGISTAESYIESDLDNDTALQQRLHQAYTSALRVFMAKAADQLKVRAIQLYLENMHRIPEWAWPGTSDFNLQNARAKRDFIQSTVDTLNRAVTFSGYQNFNDATLTDILTRLKSLMDEQLRILVADIGNDAALRRSLRAAYLSTLQTLFVRAAPQMGQTVLGLAIKYFHLVPDGLHLQVTGVSMPVPLGPAPDALGNIVFNLNGVEVTILPDGEQRGSGATTTFDFTVGRINGQTQNGVVTSFNGPPAVPQVTLQTTYASEASPEAVSAYGRGTTRDDQATGNTSLGFHEGMHGVDFIIFIRDNSPPTFTGSVGMSIADFQSAMTQWQQDWADYQSDMDNFSKRRTDCVGTTLDQFNAGRGQITHEC